jgi:tetratricopeptide (TPR) repeat protein
MCYYTHSLFLEGGTIKKNVLSLRLKTAGNAEKFSIFSLFSLMRGGLITLMVLLGGVSAHCEHVYLLGEDAHGLNDLVLAANRVERKNFKGGLGVKGKKDAFSIEITLLNHGKIPVQIDPLVDFSLSINETYVPTGDAGKSALEKPFTVHPGTQSRGTLVFQVLADDTKAIPRLVFRRGGIPVTIVCDPALAANIEPAQNGKLDVEVAVKVAQFFLDVERFDEADKIVGVYIKRFPSHPVLLMQMAAIQRRKGNLRQASEMLNQAADQGGMEKDDSLALARKAFEQGEFEVAQKLLEPLGEKGQLADRELLLLGRCWYFDDQMERAEKLLKDLQERGVQEKLVYFTLGNIADKKNDLPTAVQQWEKTLELDSNHYEAMFNIGVAHFKQDDKEKAIECWRKVLLMSPDIETRKITEETLEKVDPE